MLCHTCNNENAPQRLYCAKCGSMLNSKRHFCGFVNNESDIYCGGCGMILKESEVKPDVDIKGKNIFSLNTELITEEDIKNILDECSLQFTSRKSSLTQEEIEKLFKS